MEREQGAFRCHNIWIFGAPEAIMADAFEAQLLEGAVDEEG